LLSEGGGSVQEFTLPKIKVEKNANLLVELPILDALKRDRKRNETETEKIHGV